VIYLDSSALVKAIVEEEQTSAVRTMMVGAVVTTSALSVVEVIRAVRRRDESHVVAARRTLDAAALIPIESAILGQAGILNPTSLRSLDAIHLASALLLGVELEAFVAYNDQLLEAASALGMPVASPS
jgi:predicted nucleic acid-binding protein